MTTQKLGCQVEISIVQAASDRARVHFWHANVLERLKGFSAAKLEYEWAIKEDPDGQFSTRPAKPSPR